jgi:hypothetical protein
MTTSAGDPGGKVTRTMHDTQKLFGESGSSPPHRLTLTHVQIMPGCTVALGEGLDERGRAVSFAGDRRPMLALGEALDAGETVEVTLADWQVLAWRRS